MVASIKFTASQSDKFLRITDNIQTKETPEKSDLLIAGDSSSFFPVTVSTFDEDTGEVTVEVSRDGENFAIQDPKKTVVNRNTYSIDDRNLPKSKG